MSVSAELLRAFVGVGLHLSFSKAAKANGVSQSAISQSIKQLEKDLGIPLFERTTKSVAFTKAGRELFETAVEAFSILDNGIVKLQERVSRDYKSLHLAATDTLSKYFLLPTFKSWQEKQLDISLRVTNRPSRECVGMLESGEAQIAVVHAYDGLYDNNHLEILDLEPMQDIFVGGTIYKDESKVWSIDEIMAEPLLLLTMGASSRTFLIRLPIIDARAQLLS
ncbi:LysR family transcriptional regulator [Veillonella sp. oral taxon 780]|uniref:LysR family transcriptional regulator n=1 Tax=Veillonella sp. oral taxon 780 TaxID=671229 RepID=UPI00021A3577|nr:LysR family transcriptional regulator [Veillonella sp. oral taxon 780]EGS38789.1 transcriptional regulator, LysR family [Veillonella sp. oral taxon 780 str. F0422]